MQKSGCQVWMALNEGRVVLGHARQGIDRTIPRLPVGHFGMVFVRLEIFEVSSNEAKRAQESLDHVCVGAGILGNDPNERLNFRENPLEVIDFILAQIVEKAGR